MPWWIGLVIITAAVAYADCAVPAISEFLVLGVIPLIYLTLMYLTFKSQAESERK
jgi:hypothetical protein